jgi:hypothetical protein
MTPDEARELARECLAFIVTSFEFPPDVFTREIDGIIEIVVQAGDGNSMFCYRPLSQASEAVLGISEEVTERYKIVRDEWEAEEREHVLRGGYEYRIENLIEEFLSRADRLKHRLESEIRELPDAAIVRAEEKRRSYLAPFEEAARWMNYARKVDELRPLWKYIKEYLRKSHYDEEAYSHLREERPFRKLSDGHNIPTKLIELAYNESPQRQGLPLSLALEHARIELSLPELKVDRLYQRYYEGRKDILEEDNFLQQISRSEVP